MWEGRNLLTRSSSISDPQTILSLPGWGRDKRCCLRIYDLCCKTVQTKTYFYPKMYLDSIEKSIMKYLEKRKKRTLKED